MNERSSIKKIDFMVLNNVFNQLRSRTVDLEIQLSVFAMNREIVDHLLDLKELAF
jgi:hypothetical protein